MTRTQNAQPTVVNDDPAAFVNDRPHWRTSRDLRIEQCKLTSSVVRRWQYLDGIGCVSDPLLNERPARVIAVNQFVELLHRRSVIERPMFAESKLPLVLLKGE